MKSFSSQQGYKNMIKNKHVLSRSYNYVLTVCSYLVTYAFESEFTLYSCLNVKELLA